MPIIPYNPKLFPSLLRLITSMKQEGEFRSNSWNTEKFYDLVNRSDVFCNLADHDGQIVGFMLGYVSEQFFGDDLVACDLAVFVLPEFRGKRISLRLIAAFEAWAKARGAIQVMLGQSTGVDIERTRSLYERLGYRTVGCNVKKEL